MRNLTVFSLLLALSLPASAAGIDTLSSTEAADALKQALTQGADAAAGRLGVRDGFLGNSKVKIPLPRSLQKAEGLMRTFGMNKQADGLIVALNRAAELAAPEAMVLLLDAVSRMTVADAKGILAGGDDAATQYFRATTSVPLAEKLLPIVKNEMAQVNLVNQYNEFVSKGTKFGLATEKELNIENYVTQKLLDGFFLLMAEEERAIRKDPLGQGNKLLREVFGALR